METTSCIDLLRHGETERGNGFRGSTDDPLTSTGWEQMRAAVDRHDGHWNRIITSPLQRCRAFADSVAQRYDLPLLVDDGFQEMHFGDWEVCTAEQLHNTDAEALGRFWTDPVNNTPPGAEPLIDFDQRIRTAWRSICEVNAGENILLVTHAGVIRILLCLVLQRPLQRVLEAEVTHASMHRIRIQHSSTSEDVAILDTSI